MTIAIITNCSVTKTEPAKVHIKDLPKDLSFKEAFTAWTEKVKGAECNTSPAELYRGIAFSSIVRMQELVGRENIRIVTGGLGLLSLDTPIVSYDFTANKNHEHNMLQIVTKDPFVPHLWWEMINKELRESSTPIADMLADDTYDRVILATNSFFMKYLKSDILQASEASLSKLVIITTGASIGNIPQKLRGNILRINRDTSPAPGNRNDAVHRATLQLLDLLKADSKLVITPVIQLQEYFTDTKIEAEDVFAERQNLLEMESPDAAYPLYKRSSNKPVSIQEFKRQWIERKGIVSIKVDKPMASAALNALSIVQKDIEKISSKASTWDDDESLFKYLQIFTQTIKEQLPNAHFTCKEIADWLIAYCNEMKEEVPNRAQSPAKMAHFMSAYAETLGMHRVKVEGTSKAIYVVKT